MNAGQKQWRHGFLTGIQRAKGFEENAEMVMVDHDELEALRRDARLISIMKAMGIFDRDSHQFWPGSEQALAILSEED